MFFNKACILFVILGIIELGNSLDNSQGTYIDTSTPTHVVADQHSSADLLCRVHNLGNNTVIWQMEKDSYATSFGKYIMVMNHRLRIINENGSNDWILRNSWVRERDAGIYECLILQEPLLSHKVNLTVIVNTTTYIHKNTPTYIRAYRYSYADLLCRVENIGENKVFWTRTKDSEVLSIGTQIFVEDARFDVVHERKSRDWYLRINRVDDRDVGMYECGVTHKRDLSHKVTLNVIEPTVIIKGDKDQYFRVGSDIKLTCEVTLIKNSSHSTYWILGKETIPNWFGNSVGKRFFLHVFGLGRLDIIHVFKMLNETTSRSELTILNARKEYSGTFHCLSHSVFKFVNVHVVEDDFKIPPPKNGDEMPGSTLEDFARTGTSFFIDMGAKARSVLKQTKWLTDFISYMLA